MPRGNGSAGEKGFCTRCWRPARDHAADGLYTIAWRLGDDLRLDVADGSAELISAAGEQRVLLDASAEGNPLRRKLAAFAQALGLPPGIGLELTDPIPEAREVGFVGRTAIVAGGASLVRSDGGGAIDVTAEALLADVAPGEFETEVDAGVDELIRRLRFTEAPPVAPRLVVTPYTDEHLLAIDADGLVELRRRSWPYIPGTPPTSVLRCGATPWEDPESVTPIVGLVRARNGEYSVEVGRIHRSFVVEVFRGEDLERMWFLPAAQGVTFDAELAWAGYAVTHGHDPATPFRVLDTDTDRVELEFANPTDVELVSRNVGHELVRAESGRGHRATDSDLVGVEAVESGVEHEDLPVAYAAKLEDLAGQWLADVAEITLEARSVVRETWSGCRIVTRSYAAELDGRAWPVLDDTGAAADDFGVDDFGHLHAVDAEWQCRACGRRRCAACGPDGELEPCVDCGQSACGDCRSVTYTTFGTKACERCSAVACETCGRNRQMHGCLICGRSVCVSCCESSICVTCLSAMSAPWEPASHLPPGLAADGLRMRTVRDRGDKGGQVFLLAGRNRLEAVVMRVGEIVSWRSLATPARDEDVFGLRLQLGIARRLDVSGDLDVEVDEQSCSDAAIEAFDSSGVRSEALVVADDRVVWIELEGREDVAIPLESGAAGLYESLVDAQLLAEEYPEPAAPGTFDIHEVMARTIEDSPRAISARLRLAGKITWIDAEGLHSMTIAGAATDDGIHAEWAAPGDERFDATDWAWIDEEWTPDPDPRGLCELDDVAAAIVSQGAHISLGVRDAGDAHPAPRWFAIDHAPDDVRARSLGVALTGSPLRLEIVDSLRFNEVSGIDLAQARLVQRGAECLVVAADGEADDARLDSLIADWSAHAAPRWPVTATTLRQGLRDELAGLADRLTPNAAERTAVRIGVRFEDEWRGYEFGRRLRYDVMPPDPQATIACEATGQLTIVPTLDREGHIVADPDRCPYCAAATCRLCRDATRACDSCGQPVCGRCRGAPSGAGLWLCRGCGALAVCDNSAAGEAGVTAGVGSVVMRGADSLHTVFVVIEPGAVTSHLRAASGATSSHLPIPLASAWLTDRAGAPPASGAR